jgi:hypothetical protein
MLPDTLARNRLPVRRRPTRVAQRSAGSSIARWLPAIGAVGVGAYAFYDTRQVAARAIGLFGSDTAS